MNETLIGLGLSRIKPDAEGRISLHVGGWSARHFAPGMYVELGYQSRKWRHRVWRWLTKRNTRVHSIEGGIVHLERCR